MAKTKKSTKKSLLIASLALIVVFALSLVVMAVVPYSATSYTYKGENTQITYVFKSDKYQKTTVATILGSENTNKVDVSYVIEKNDEGENVVKEGNTKLPLGTINAYKLIIGDTVYKNAFTNTWKIISIVGLSLGGVGVVLYFVLGTKATSKKKK